MVARHPLAWRMVNLGFVAATILTIAGLGLLATRPAIADGPRALLVAGLTADAVGGLLWCVVLAVRNRTTPELARLVAANQPTEPAESILGAALGGLFAAFVWATSLALLAIAAGLLSAGVVAAPVALVAVVITFVGLGGQIRTGDTIPAILYLPTLLIGVALLAGWS